MRECGRCSRGVSEYGARSAKAGNQALRSNRPTATDADSGGDYRATRSLRRRAPSCDDTLAPIAALRRASSSRQARASGSAVQARPPGGTVIARIAVWEPMPDDERQWVIDAAKTVPGVLDAYHLVDPVSGNGLSIAFFDDEVDVAEVKSAISRRQMRSAGMMCRARHRHRRRSTVWFAGGRPAGHPGSHPLFGRSGRAPRLESGTLT